ncbi:MAG: molybdopterin-dependent oxidoreductase [Nitrospirota bacterium]|nr:molybdopterin-dependent oxidoreductase [Nitrospirota bacterium]
MENTVTVTIDGITVKVKPTATILDAAKQAGVRIPVLCADDKLHPYGSCRICLVEIEKSPRKFTPSCTTPVADNMVVKTMTPDLFEARKRILELLLCHHPLDCPVCDKAGNCQLQDLVHEYGLGPSKFTEKKRVVPPNYKSAVIDREVARCVLCGKCVRVCREQNAVGELAFTRRGKESKVSTDFDQQLDCEFCGECVEICPVGALTTKQFKYRGRTWNMERTQSVCNYCGCGCRMVYETRQGRIVRVRSAARNYLCGKGRFGWDAVHHADRLTTPLVRVSGELVPATWDEALAMVVTNLNVIKNKRGADSIGGLGSVRTTNEESYLFQKFMRSAIGTNNVDMLARLKVPKGLNTTFFSGELSNISGHDVVLVLDGDVAELNPLTGIEIVRAVNRNYKKLILVNSGYNKLNRIASCVLEYVSPDAALADLLPALKSGQGTGAVADAAAILKEATSVAVIIPARLPDGTYYQVRELLSLLKGATTYPVVKRSNFLGALDMGVLPGYYPGYQKVSPDVVSRFASAWNCMLPEIPGKNALEMLDAIKQGSIAALYIMGDDPAGSDAGLKPVLEKLEFLVVQDIFLTETAKMADVVLPAVSSAEKAGTLTSLERRLQGISPAEEPLGDAQPDWNILQTVAKKMGSAMHYASPSDIMKEIRALVPLYADLAVGSVWPAEKSPLHGSETNLSLLSDSVEKNDVITSERLLFSSGTTTTRSKELTTVCTFKVEA